MVHDRPPVHPSPSRNRRERTRLLAARDRLRNRLAWADTAREQAAERVAALAVEIADVDRRIGELAEPKADR